MIPSRPGKIPPTSVRRLTSLFSRSWVVGPDPPPDLAGEGGERQDVLAGVVEMGGRGRQLGLQRGDDLGVLGPDRGRVRLLEDGPDQCRHPRLVGQPQAQLWLQDLTGVSIGKQQLEQMVIEAARDAPGFYPSRPAVACPAGLPGAISADGRGVARRPGARRAETARKPASAPGHSRGVCSCATPRTVPVPYCRSLPKRR